MNGMARNIKAAAIAIIALILAACSTAGVGGPTSGTTAPVDPSSIQANPNVIVALVTNNQLVYRRSGNQLELVCWCGPKIQFHQIAQTAREAIVAIEDQHFWGHRGIDLNGKIRAGIKTVLGDTQGGSTITEQLIKNTVLTSSQVLDRKIAEAQLAYQLELVMSKADILENYFNQVHFGHIQGKPIVGIEQASRYYFGRSASELSLLESAILAGMVQGPSLLNYFEHREESMARAAVVLRAMVRDGYITQAAMTSALGSERPRGDLEPIWIEARSYLQWVQKEVLAQNPGLVIDTSTRIPLALQVITQANAESAFRRSVAALDVSGHEAGYVLMGFDGRVITMIGQRNFASSQINFVTDTNSQPASSFKPFVYAAAMEAGLVSASSALRRDLARSDNARAASLAAEAGYQAVADLARRMGVASPLRLDPSLALGGSEVSLLEMATAFIPFADGGHNARPYGHFGVIKAGRIIDWTEPLEVQILSAKTSEEMRSMLGAVVQEGTGIAARSIPHAAGKTGTSDGPRDAWFVGMTNRHVSAIWIGRPDDRPMPGIDGAKAAGVWAAVEKALPNE